jgi:hypothetical protein
MSCIVGEGFAICGNFAKLSKKKPTGYDKAYKCIVPYSFKWRTKVGKVECTCKEVEEHYAPYYGFTWYHTEGCAILKHIKKYPGINNLFESDLSVIACSE